MLVANQSSKNCSKACSREIIRAGGCSCSSNKLKEIKAIAKNSEYINLASRRKK